MKNVARSVLIVTNRPKPLAQRFATPWRDAKRSDSRTRAALSTTSNGVADTDLIEYVLRVPLLAGRKSVLTITLDGDQLFVDMRGTGKVPMIPLSQTSFSPRLLGTFEFVKDSMDRSHRC